MVGEGEWNAPPLTAQRSAKKAYQPGDPVTINHAYPPSGETGHLEKFGDASVHEGAILLRVHVFDYDDVTYTSADGSVELKNREREIFHRLRTTWELQSGGGQIWYDHFGLYAWYTPPALQNDEPSREVTLVCKVYDETVDPNRRDVLPEDEGGAENGSLRQAALSLLRFNLVKEPTIDTITCAVINERGEAVGVSSPIASGVGPDDEVRLRFTFTTRRNKTLWELHSVQWQVPWAGTTSGSKGEIFTTEPIPLSEAHDFFDVTVTATFRRLKPILPPPPEPEYEYVTDTKSRRFPLCFSKTDHDEWNNNARGESVRGVLDPPNWFDGKLDHARHWGHVLDGFGEMDAALAGGYVVYYADKVPDDPKWWYLRGAHALFDWQGLFAPTGHQYKESYRGRIYLFGEPLLSVTDYLPEAFTDGLVAGGIDHVGRVLAHEFAHRNLWLQPGNWEGFTNAQIGGPQERGGPGHWFPGERRWGYDRDEDKIRDGYERLVEQEYHCLAPPPNLPDTADFAPYLYAVAHWWAGDQTIKNRREYIDFEMHAYLWGTWGKPGTVWKGYRIGSKDTEDWSTDGRNDFYK